MRNWLMSPQDVPSYFSMGCEPDLPPGIGRERPKHGRKAADAQRAVIVETLRRLVAAFAHDRSGSAAAW